MKNTKANKHIRMLALVMAFMLLVTALAGCEGPQGEQGIQGEQGEPGKDGKDGVDGINGKDGLNGVDGKDGVDGTNGVDGLTPFIGENGNWWIGEIDTGIRAAGKDGINGTDGKDGFNGTDGKDGINGTDGKDGADGLTPFIGENGNWWIGETDTGIQAIGQNGADGTNGVDGNDGANGADGLTPFIGENGNWWIGETDTQVPAFAQDGADGKNVEFRVENNWLQWKYDSDTEWRSLYEVTHPEPTENEAMVSFHLQGGVMPSGTHTSIIVTIGTSIVLPTPSYAGYTFAGWYLEGGEYPVSPTYRVHGDTMLYAKWLPGTAIVGTPIFTLDDLVHISDDLSGTYILMNDIDCMGLTIPPIGATEANPFRGIFDGNGYTIRNLSGYASDVSGLFGYNYGTIQNLKMEDCNTNITSNNKGAFNIGMIAAFNYGTIERCCVTDCSITLTKSSNYGWFSGMICGQNAGSINNCFASGSICANGGESLVVGGVTSTNSQKIRNCITNISLTVSGSAWMYASGIYCFGNSYATSDATVENCIVLGPISVSCGNTQKACVAGDITASEDGTVFNCYKTEILSVSSNKTVILKAIVNTNEMFANEQFYSITLGWDSDIWDWSNVDIANGKYPKLKVIR